MKIGKSTYLNEKIIRFRWNLVHNSRFGSRWHWQSCD